MSPQRILPRLAVFALAALTTLAAPAGSSAQAAGRHDDRPFRHAEHEAFACTRCHSTEAGHGALTITSRRDCLACHHAPQQAEPCAACHDPASLAPRAYHRSVTLQVADAPPRPRSLPFQHYEHEAITCSTCHISPVSLSAAPVECTSCHADHHEPQIDCVLCHAPPPAQAHPREAHVTCSGSGCHEPLEFAAAERTRSLCLSCHQDLFAHEPSAPCIDCHVLPPARR